jgi:hypothetical protein
MLTRARVLVLAICAFALGCDALPKFQFQLQSKIQREFHITSALVMIVDTTTMIVAIFDDAHAAYELKERAAFEEQVAYYAVTQFQPSKWESSSGARRAGAWSAIPNRRYSCPSITPTAACDWRSCRRGGQR